jgi:hypothetical protein
VNFDAMYSISGRDIKARDWSSCVDFESTNSNITRCVEAKFHV